VALPASIGKLARPRNPFRMKMTDKSTRAPIDWVTTVLFSSTFAVAVIGVPLYGWLVGYSLASWAWFAVFLIATGLSITAGYHRLWSHRSYQAHWSVRLFFMLFGAMAIENSILVWAAGHRPHHRFVDDEALDPYSSRRGLWFSHIGWMLRRYKSGEPDFKYVKDLERDPIVMFQHRHYVAIVLAMNFGLPLLVGVLCGDIWAGLLLAGVLRLVVNHHVTFLINSLAHAWGRQTYTDTNTSRDNPVLALLTYGEGYHNFHHLFAHDYRNGIRWWQWDPTKWLIRGMSFVGLATKLRMTPPVAIEQARLDMQFNRAQAQVARKAANGDGAGLAELHDFVTREYAAFTATLAEWATARDAWLASAREQVAERFAEQLDRVHFTQYAREIEARLRAQRRRLEQMVPQLA
jgi:stearoyl-CoA desaturase (Delta-9 desaturase)